MQEQRQTAKSLRAERSLDNEYKKVNKSKRKQARRNNDWGLSRAPNLWRKGADYTTEKKKFINSSLPCSLQNL